MKTRKKWPFGSFFDTDSNQTPIKKIITPMLPYYSAKMPNFAKT